MTLRIVRAILQQGQTVKKKPAFEKIRKPARYERVIRHVDYFLDQNIICGKPVKASIGVSNLGQPLSERMTLIRRWLPSVESISFGEVNDECGKVVSHPFTTMNVKRKPLCITPWQTFGIRYNGDVTCCSIYIAKTGGNAEKIGNIHEETFHEIWKGEKFTTLRKKLVENGHIDEMCQRCERWRAQFEFPDELRDGLRIYRNGFWTVISKDKKES